MLKDALHQLIHSLSASEKRYYAQSKGDSNLTVLFNAINKLDVYDRAVIEKRLSKNPDLLKHLSKYKNNTYSDIIRVMRTYKGRKEPNVDIRLRTYLTEIVFLIERGLYENAMKLIRSARKLAMQYDKYASMLGIVRHEIDLSKQLYKKGYIETTHALLEEEKKIMSILNDERRYNEIAHLIEFFFIQNSNLGRQNRLEYLNELLSDELLTNEERAISFTSKYQYHQIYGLYYYLTGFLQKSCECYGKILDCWDAYPHQKHQNILIYIEQTSNYLILCADIKEYTTFEYLLDKIKKEIKPKHPYEEAAMFGQIYNAELNYYFNRLNFDKIDTILAEIRPKLKKHFKTMSTDLYRFIIVITHVSFIMGKYKEALKGYNQIIMEKLPVPIDFQCRARLYKLMIAYEQKHENFDNLYRSTKRFFNKIDKKEVEESYLLFMEFLYRLRRSPLFEKKALYVEYQSALQKLYDNAVKRVGGLRDMIKWIEHMMTGKSIVEIYKELGAIK